LRACAHDLVSCACCCHPTSLCHQSSTTRSTNHAIELAGDSIEPIGGILNPDSVTANAVWTSHLEGKIRVVPMRTVDERVATERLAAIRTALGAEVRVRP
jgi:hypothetical protein